MSPKDEILNDRRYEWTNNIESSVSSHYCGMECEAWHKRENGRRKHEKRHTHTSDRGRESEKSTVNCCVQKYLLWFVSALFGRPFAWYRFGIVIVVALLLCIHAWIARMYFVLCASKTNSHFIFYFYFHCDTFLLLVHTKFHWNSYCISTTNSYLLFFLLLFGGRWCCCCYRSLFLLLSSACFAHYVVVCGHRIRQWIGYALATSHRWFDLTPEMPLILWLIIDYSLQFVDMFFLLFRSFRFDSRCYYYDYDFIDVFVWWRCQRLCAGLEIVNHMLRQNVFLRASCFFAAPHSQTTQ